MALAGERDWHRHRRVAEVLPKLDGVELDGGGRAARVARLVAVAREGLVELGDDLRRDGVAERRDVGLAAELQHREGAAGARHQRLHNALRVLGAECVVGEDEVLERARRVDNVGPVLSILAAGEVGREVNLAQRRVVVDG